jgi:hypothetical protein
MYMSGLAGNQTLVEGVDGATLRTSSVEVTGEAIINNRKKKLIPSYELEIKGKWSGMYVGSSHGSCARGIHPLMCFCICPHTYYTVLHGGTASTFTLLCAFVYVRMACAHVLLCIVSMLHRQSCASLNFGQFNSEKVVTVAYPCI